METLEKMQIIDIDATDIFYKMQIYLEETNYFHLSDIKDKLEVSLDCLKKYLLEKLEPFGPLDVNENSSVLEIVKFISDRISRYTDHTKIDPIIHYLINLLSVYLDFYVVWEINPYESDLPNCLELRDGRLDKLITCRSIDYYKTFSLLYSYLIGESKINPDVKKLEIK